MAKKKGKKGQAKARAKNGGGGARAAPRHPHPQRFNGRAWQTSDVAAPRFTLRDEALWTSNHRTTAFDPSKKLRHMPIAFVSAGLLEGTLAKKLLPSSPRDPSPSPPRDLASPVAVNLSKMALRTPSPAPSTSSSNEEVVVFKGRNQPQPLPVEETTASIAPSKGKDPSKDPTDTPANPLANLLPNAPATATATANAPAASSTNPTSVEVTRSEGESDAVNDEVFSKRRGGRPIWDPKENVPWESRSKPGIGWIPVRDRPDMHAFLRGEASAQDFAPEWDDACNIRNKSQQDTSEVAMDEVASNLRDTGYQDVDPMDDYASNIRDSGDAFITSAFANRPLDIDSNSDWDSQTIPDRTLVFSESPADPENSEVDRLEYYDQLSTSSDIVEELDHIIRKRSRRTGLQYLVVYKGYTEDDAHWLPAKWLCSAKDKKVVNKFESDLLASGNKDIYSDEFDDGDDDSDSELEDEDDPDEDDEDEELDDETMARVLQKQEELGLESDELLLHAADEYFKSPQEQLEFDRPNKKRQHKAQSGFPSASAMADALTQDPYGAFDIMDTERPSLRPRKKGRRGQLPPELEDSEFTEEFRAQWDADRSKKRIKKAEREELRKQGLLGRKGKAPDLSVKYKDGIEFMEVIEEIRGFMDSDESTLSLPPMEKYRRALMHELVVDIGLSSKSHGSGARRFMVCTKKKYTSALNNEYFYRLIERRKFKARWAGAPGEKRPRQKGKSGQLGRPATGYKEGDIVGGSAPELGPENRGRALLEKMGWSKGMALGAANNKGITEPIAHVYKTGRAGL